MADNKQNSKIDCSKDARLVKVIDSIIDQICNFEDEIPLKTSIYKVPSKLTFRDVNSPHFVSIGPIHSGRDDLLAMEEIKLWYSMFLFYRSEDPAGTVQECCEAIINLNEQAREYYAHDLKKFDEYELMKILLVDGCFLLELFLRRSDERVYTYLNNKKIDKYGEINSTNDDLILGNPWMCSAVCQDLALLENQIPLVVLETLFSKIKPYLKSSNSVKEFILRFFSPDLNTSKATFICIDEEENHPKPKEEPRHILEMLHKGLLPRKTLERDKKRYSLVYSATKLLESGVDIKKKDVMSNETDSFNRHLLEIHFDHSKGILYVPQFSIGGTTSLITKNLVSFEQCSFGRSQSHHVTAYVMFMKSLISSEHDIKLLKRIGIITTHPGSATDENVMEFFNACSEGVALKDFYFSDVCEEVEEYISKNWMHIHSYVTCLQSRRRKYAAILAGRYCPDACMTIAFFAATMLLLLTCLQTFYTVYPYYH